MDKKNNSSSTKKSGLGLKLFFAKQYSKFLKNTSYVGVSGAYFKTTTAMACQAVLSQKEPTVISAKEIKDLNDLESAIFKVSPKVKKVVLELQLDNTSEVEHYIKLMNFSTLVITSLDEESNLEPHNLSETVTFQQVRLIDTLKSDASLVVNWDDVPLRKLIESKNLTPIFYGTDSDNCHVWAGNIRIRNFQTVFELNYGVERAEIKSRFLGRHQIYPLICAAALGINEGISLGNIKKALETLEPLPQRFQPLIGHNDSIIIDDTYHVMLVTIEDAIDTINFLPARRRIVVLGDLNRGEFKSSEIFKVVARKIYKDRVDVVLLGGESTQPIAEELLSLGFIADRLQSGLQIPQIVVSLLNILSKGDVVLIKGSKSSKLSEVVKKVSKKGEF